MFGGATKMWFGKIQKPEKKPWGKRSKWAAKILKHQRERILKELDVNKVLPYLVYEKVFSLGEYKEILTQESSWKRAEMFLEKLSSKGPTAFCAFCVVLEEVWPHLLTCFLLEGDDQVPGIKKSCVKNKKREEARMAPHNQAHVREQSVVQPPTPTVALPGPSSDHRVTPSSDTSNAGASSGSQGKPSLRRIKGRIHRSKSLDSIELLDSNSGAMEETVIWEQHTVALHRAAGFGFGIAISGGKDNPHFQSGETSIVISDVLKGGPAEGLLQENDRVVMVNAVSMDNVEHAYAVQQLRKSGKNAQITIRRKKKVQIPVARTERETVSEHEEDSYEDEAYDETSARSGPSAYSSSKRSERSMAGRRDRSASRERSLSPRSDRRSVVSNLPPKPAKVTLVKSRKSEEYGLRLASHIFVKDISPESLAAKDGNIQEGDVVLKINGTVTENLSLTDAKKLIERSKGKLKMVVQRDERATLLNIPDLDDSIPSANASDRDDISEIHSLASDHSNRSHDRSRRSRSRSPDRRSEPSDHSRHSPQQISNGSHRSRDEERIAKPGAISTPVRITEEAVISKIAEQPVAKTFEERSEKQIPPLPEPKPVYAQPGQPDVDLPVSPSDAPIPSAAHDEGMLRPSMKLVKFKKGESVGLRLAGGNDVGIFVAGVLEDSPAAKEGLEEGDQILRVNNVDFANIIREEAVLFLLDLPRGEEVTILAQKKKDVYRRIVESDVGDSFYIRTHFEYEKESPYGLSFNKGEVFRVVDTLYNGKLGSWLAIRIGKNHKEVERGIIPNKNRAEQLSSVQYTLPKTAGGDRADFWRFRGLRSSKRNLRKSREDLTAQPVQSKYPAYERVVLREAGFLRPVVIFGPIADVAREKLGREEPDLFELARSEPRDAGTDQRNSGIIRLHTIKQIIDRDKHAVLDITPNAVDRLNYAQWYPIVVFLNPDSKQGVKNMRTRLCSESRKSARKLYERALKLRKNNHHLFTSIINMNSMNDGWYGALKETTQQQQNQLVWVSEGRADGAPDDDLDLHDDRLSYLSAPGSEYSMYSTDSRHTSDYEDTDTEGGAYTDQELDETLNDEVGPLPESAITRSSEPVCEDPPVIQDAQAYPPYQPPVQPDPLPRTNSTGFKIPASQQKAEAVPVIPNLPHQPEPIAVVSAPSAVDNTVYVAGMNHEERAPAPQSTYSPQAGSLRRPTHELARSMLNDPEQSRSPLAEPPKQMYKKDPYGVDEPLRQNHGIKEPVVAHPVNRYEQEPPPSYAPQPQYQDEQPYRDYDQPPYRYESTGNFMEQKSRSYDSHLQYETRVPPYDDQWSHYDENPSQTYPARTPFENQHPQDYDPRLHYEESTEREYTLPQPRYEEPSPLGYDNRPRYEQPAKSYGKPVQPRYEEQLRYEEQPPIGYEARPRYEPEPHAFPPPVSRSPEPNPYYDPPVRTYTQGPQRGYKPGQYEPPLNADAALPPPPQPQAKPEPPIASTKPLPPTPATEPEDDPAMKRQSVLTRVKMFENKRSVSVDRAKESGDPAAVRSAEVAPKPVTGPTTVPKANSLSRLDQEKPPYRAPEPQKPQTKPPEDIVRSNHYDPEEDEEYYRKQLSYFDRRSFDSKPAPQPTQPANRFPDPAKPVQPQTQSNYSNYSSRFLGSYTNYDYLKRNQKWGKPAELEPVDKISVVEKRYEPVPQVTPPPSQYGLPSQTLSNPSVPPPVLPKPPLSEVSSLQLDVRSSPKSKPEPPTLQTKPTTVKPNNREDTVQSNYLQQKSFPEKAPVNGTDQPPKPVTSSYNRFNPKPYTSSARPFERKFESPKFNHNLLPNDTQQKPELQTKPQSTPPQPPVKPQSFPQPAEFDSGMDTFNRTTENQPKYQQNNVNAVPKAIPVSPGALDDDDEDEGHTVVATARGIFNSNGGVLSSIETGVSIIIPQGAIPEGVEQEIYFKVCRDNSILPPLDKEKGETLLSPLVMCGPHGLKFLKPVELRLPHCDPKSWQNKSLSGDPNYLVGANCVSVLIDHF
ncbi:tight junction protein ZO-1 isoform X5 [Acipenser ruthenus]|uniref:tight junction protein ZO-1 isoform X5 n=1 Tax=Acipenser ruthenus TaxID=7906 RepID=UPI002741BADE|nr:tight junction protein ZO-1 isoform X5 [Acipenser ruthenus]